MHPHRPDLDRLAPRQIVARVLGAFGGDHPHLMPGRRERSGQTGRPETADRVVRRIVIAHDHHSSGLPRSGNADWACGRRQRALEVTSHGGRLWRLGERI